MRKKIAGLGGSGFEGGCREDKAKEREFREGREKLCIGRL